MIYIFFQLLLIFFLVGGTNYILDRKERMKLRRKLKVKMKKMNKIKANEDVIEKKTDIVQFGEVVHQPPHLKQRPRGCVPEKVYSLR